MIIGGFMETSSSLLAGTEEAGCAYKDIHKVVEAVELSGISKKVAAFEPIGNIKG